MSKASKEFNKTSAKQQVKAFCEAQGWEYEVMYPDGYPALDLLCRYHVTCLGPDPEDRWSRKKRHRQLWKRARRELREYYPGLWDSSLHAPAEEHPCPACDTDGCILCNETGDIGPPPQDLINEALAANDSPSKPINVHPLRLEDITKAVQLGIGVAFCGSIPRRLVETTDMMDKLKQPPICPFCHDSMARIHMQMHDGSGWLHCWACDCESAEEYSTPL